MLHFETIDPSTLELLIALQNIKGLNKTRLVGGTSLALQIGHRISVDLDFFAYNLQEDLLSIIASITDIPIAPPQSSFALAERGNI